MGRVLKGIESRIFIDIKPEFAGVCTSYYQVFQPSTASCCNLYLWKNQGYDENGTSCGRDFLKHSNFPSLNHSISAARAGISKKQIIFIELCKP